LDPNNSGNLLVGSIEIRGLYPPFGWSQRIQVVVDSFRLDPPSSCSLQNLEFGASYELILDIYKKEFHGFLPFGFPRKYWCTVFLM
jgi:hypothetical protein